MTRIARLTIRLAEVEPPVRRVVDVPLDLTLARLHKVIQAAMGWEDDHMHEFRASAARSRRPGDDPIPEARDTLEALLARAGRKRPLYIYDFGDQWEHELSVKLLPEASVPAAPLPALVEAEGACPPEDSGGARGYMDMLAARADPRHDRHQEYAEWLGDGFDPADASAARATQALARLARSWTRRPTATT